MLDETIRAAYRSYKRRAIIDADRSPFIRHFRDVEWLRRIHPAGAACAAFMMARADKAAKPSHLIACPGPAPKLGAFARDAAKSSVWFDDKSSTGLRFVGYADEIADRAHSRRIRNRGWFVDEFQDETLRGVVFQLPAKGRRARFVAGYEESCSGGVFLDLSTLEIGEFGAWSDYPDDAALEAAGHADECARVASEKEREYNEAWQAAQTAAALIEESRAMRRHVLGMCAERRKLRKVVAENAAPLSCAALEKTIREGVESIYSARARAEELREHFEAGQPQAWSEGFAT